jgi:hypothetical protein
MPFDKQKAADWIRKNALPPYGNMQCATYVRKALEKGGVITAGHPRYAKDWGPTLLRAGFHALSGPALAYVPAVGDVIVFQGTSKSMSGHIELYDGKNWVSDFIQPGPGIWPGPSYRNESPPYQAYRY